MARRLAFYAWAVGLAACAIAARAAPPDISEGAQLAATAAEKPIPPAALEAAIHSGRVTVRPHSLTLFPANAKPVTLRDRDCVPENVDNVDCQHFELAADLPSRHFFLVWRQDYEGGAYFLFDDRSGRKTPIDAAPIFSADGRRFLSQNDNVATDHENNLEIWRRAGDHAVIEWAHSVRQADIEMPLRPLYHTEMVSWQDNRISLAFSSGAGYDTNRKQVRPALHWTGELVRTSAGWQLNADWPKSK